MTPSATTPHGNWMNNSAGYQTLLVFLLSLNFGIVFFDRQALNVLMPSAASASPGRSLRSSTAGCRTRLGSARSC